MDLESEILRNLKINHMQIIFYIVAFRYFLCYIFYYKQLFAYAIICWLSWDAHEFPQTMRKVSEILREEMSRWIAGDHDLHSVLQYPKLQHLSSPCPRLITLGRVFRRISTHSFLLPRPLVHFWKGGPPYGGSHYLRRGISISISCGNSFRNSPGPRALSYYGIMRDVIRIILNRMIHIQSSRFNHSSPYQLKYQVFIHVIRLQYNLSRKKYFTIYKTKILIFCVLYLHTIIYLKNFEVLITIK